MFALRIPKNNGGSGGGGSGGISIKAEDVISKLKDDGDFDRLRVKIIRKLKDDEELRSNIISLVKQSAALNCPGVENMKPRQISDAIHREIGDKLMSQVSDVAWNIIRSADGMKTEIRETVQSVYEQLSYPNGKENGESSSTMNSQLVPYEFKNNGDTAGASKIDGEPIEPPGFVLTNPHKQIKNIHTNKPNKAFLTLQNGKGIDGNKEENLHYSEQDFNSDAPPGFSCVLKHKKSGPFSDEDPEVPPGFG